MHHTSATPDIYISFFMFTVDMQPDNAKYRRTVVAHMKKLQTFGYKGFEFPIAPGSASDFAKDLKNYTNLRRYMDRRGLADVAVATNVMATRTFDPSSPYPEQRDLALEYLKSRVDITAAMRGEIMMGPIVIPYGVFPTTDFNVAYRSDELQDKLKIRYKAAQPVLNKLGKYAKKKKVKLAIEPITHWETPGPNTLSQLINFLKGVKSKQVGVVIDSAHETMDGAGPEVFKKQVAYLARQKRLHYIQASSPDRGAVHTSWIPWQSFLEPVLKVYQGPIAVEVFNAIPPFLDPLRLSRRKFWIPGEDKKNRYPSAYNIADKAIQKTQSEIKKILEGK